MRPKDLTLRRGLLATFWLMGWKSLHPPRGMDARPRAVPPLASAYAPRMPSPPGSERRAAGLLVAAAYTVPGESLSLLYRGGRARNLGVLYSRGGRWVCLCVCHGRDPGQPRGSKCGRAAGVRR